MKLSIDFDNKVITLVEPAILGKVMENLEKMFPDGSWAGFTLDTTSKVVWSNPVVFREYPVYVQPYKVTWYTGGTGTASGYGVINDNLTTSNTGTSNVISSDSITLTASNGGSASNSVYTGVINMELL